jgi:hypothetical protein
MAFAKRNRMTLQRVIGLILACLFAFGGTVSAAPDYKELKAEIKKLEKSVDDAGKERRDADSKLADNLAAQKKAQGKELEKLKDAGKELAKTAGQKAEALATAQQNLDAKQAELRAAAAAHAVRQLTDAGTIETRVGEATTAVADWAGALGALPQVPPLRPLDDIDDPELQDAVRAQDKKALEAFEKWASGEETRTEKEIKQVKEIVDGESKWKTSKDGGKELIDAAKALKEELETRKKDLGDLRKTAKDRLRQIK